MRPIPPGLKRQLNDDPFMAVCIYDNALCEGRVEWDHVFIWAGRQVNEWFAILPVCYYHHRGGGMDRKYTEYVALSRVDDVQLFEIQKKYPRADWIGLKKRLVKKYGDTNNR